MKRQFLLGCFAVCCRLAAQQPAPACQSLAPYTVISRDRADSVNSDVLVKTGAAPKPCAYRVEAKDFEIKDVNTNHFIKLAEPYLFLGGGTGPDGGDLAVFDLKSRKKVWQHVFMGDTIRISGGVVTITDRIGNARREQCKDFDKITKMGLSATMVGDISFPVSQLAQPEKLKALKAAKPRCIATQ